LGGRGGGVSAGFSKTNKTRGPPQGGPGGWGHNKKTTPGFSHGWFYQPQQNPTKGGGDEGFKKKKKKKKALGALIFFPKKQLKKKKKKNK